MFFCFPILLPIEKGYPTKQRYCCNSLSCKLLPQLIDKSGGFFFVDRQLSYCSLSHSSSMQAANDCGVVLTFQVTYFLQRSYSSSLASASRVQHDSESWHARQRAYVTNTYNVNSYDSRTRAWADVFTQRKPYHNVARRSPLIFSIFLHQISCTRVQSISETTSQKTHLVGHQAWSPRLAPQCLAFQ